MSTTAWIVLVLAFLHGGWLFFDGLHAFMKGDYVTPSTGRHAGQLGPWSKLFVAIAGLWYLPFGTLLSLIQIVLLTLPAGRAWPPDYLFT